MILAADALLTAILAAAAPADFALVEPSSDAPTRPSYAAHQLAYLGRDLALDFNQWSGEYKLWQYERGELSSCDAFSWPPLTSGRWPKVAFHEFVFLGFMQLAQIDVASGEVQVSECNEEPFLPSGPALQCTRRRLECAPLLRHTLAPLVPEGAVADHELVYLGASLLLHYERTTGNWAMHRYARCTAANTSACGLSAPLARGALGAGEHHTYLGDDLVLSWRPRAGGRYEIRRVERHPDGGGALARLVEGTLDLRASWSADALRHRLVSLRGGEIVDYDKETGEYRILRLADVAAAGGANASSAASGSALRLSAVGGGTLPQSAEDECTVHTTSDACLAASQLGGKCGWCQSAGECRRGSPWGPCKRSLCNSPASCTPWHTAAGDVSVVAAAPAPVATPTVVAAANTTTPPPPAVAAGERPPAELVVGTRLWRLTAFALHGLQSDACAEAKAARGTAACAVLGGARLLRVRSVATHVLPSHVRFGVGGGSLLSHEAEAEVVAADADGGAYAHHALSLVLLEQLDAPDNFLLIHAKVRVLPSSGGMGGAAGGALDGPLDAPLTLDAAAFANFALEPPSAAAAALALRPPGIFEVMK